MKLKLLAILIVLGVVAACDANRPTQNEPSRQNYDTTVSPMPSPSATPY